MKKEIPLIKNPGDFKDPRAKSLLLKYNLSIEELPELKQKLYEKGNVSISPFIAEKPSLIKELVASTILYLEFTKRDLFLIPYSGFSYAVLSNGQKKLEHPFMYALKKEWSIESYEKNAKKFLIHTKKLERCVKHRYLGTILWPFPVSINYS